LIKLLPAPLLLLLFTLQLTIVTLYYSIACYSNESSSTCPELCYSCCHQKSPKFHHITPILKSLRWLTINERIKIRSLKTGQPSHLLRSLLSFASHRSTRYSSLITFNLPFLTPLLTITDISFYHSAPVLWNSLTSDQRHVTHRALLSPILNSLVSDLPTCLFLISFTVLFLLSLYSPSLYQDISPVLTRLHFCFSYSFRYHSPSFNSWQFYRI